MNAGVSPREFGQAERSLRDQFLDPGAEYRSSPFWAWNGRLDAAELIRQAEQMKEQGMGGFFMHSREGLETKYMGEDWMTCVSEVVAAARKLGLRAWLYDEDRFPSGGAGGRVASMGDAYRAKAVTLEMRASPPGAEEAGMLAVFRAQLREGRTIVSLVRVSVGTAEEEVTKAKSAGRDGDGEGDSPIWLLLRREVSAGSEWFNGEAPVDNLNPAAVASFISVTHEPYKQIVGEHFGGAVPGIFTDEPSIADFHCRYAEGRPWLPWTEDFDDLFMERRGYDLIDRLPYLFLEGEKSAKTRHDYWRTISERFEEAYSRQIGEWCETNGLSFTGHYLIEHNLGISTRVTGAVMPHYRHQHVPGIDILDEKTEEWLTVKQCTSVAHQYGRKHVLSETYGCCGWDFTFEGQKWIGDWQFAMGVTIRCQHLSLYSLNGCRKRDFPPVFSDVSPWWKYNHVMENYFARLAAVLSDGRPIRDLLVIHPASTAWTMVGSDPHSYLQWEDPSLLAVNEYEAELVRTMKTLLGQHIDFDFGDETIMADDGYVREGKFFVKNAPYRAVLLPTLRTVLRSTFELLKKFADEGGLIIAIGGLPCLIDGEQSDDWMAPELVRHPGFCHAKDAAEAVSILEQHGLRQIALRSEYGLELPQLLYMFREHEEGYSLFVVNNDRTTGAEAEVRLPVRGDLEEWYPLTGEVVRKADPTTPSDSGGMRFVDRLGAAGSKLYWIRKVRKHGRLTAQSAPTEERFTYRMAHELTMATTTLPVKCPFSRTMPNALPLDRCSYRMNGEPWSEPMQVWQAQRQVRDRLGMRDIHYNGQQQRFRWTLQPHEKDGAAVDWRFFFEIGEELEEDLYVAVEHADRFRIKMDGKEVPVQAEGYFIDRDWLKTRLTQTGVGCHELVLSCLYRNADEMENIYVLGDFAVDAKRRIVREPNELSVGDWTLQGYPHYPGNIVYHYTVEPNASLRDAIDGERSCKLILGEWQGVCAELRVNGHSSGVVAWEDADGIDIAPSMIGADGECRIDIEVAGSLRNLLGPFHQSGQHNPWMDWSFFEREDARDEPGYRLKPYGLMVQPSIHCSAKSIIVVS
ncbi:glycosyl hydrolase [Cohnella soli]|uniref:Glycosyl hydrolase n=1 Tax=Cohnella soli TaxID=425005 RepID=A0ABW0I415_9BACL